MPAIRTATQITHRNGAYNYDAQFFLLVTCCYLRIKMVVLNGTGIALSIGVEQVIMGIQWRRLLK